jgi:hypothetical protein
MTQKELDAEFKKSMEKAEGKTYAERQTNGERVAEYMDYGSALNQAFVIDAVTKMAERVVANEAEVIAAAKNGFINGPAWVQCAKDWLVSADKPRNIGG